MSDEVHLNSIENRLTGNVCPRCGYSAEGGTALNIGERAKRNPAPGDYAVCAKCGDLNRYDKQLKLAPLTPHDRRLLARDPRLAKLLEMATTAAARLRRSKQ
jgi:DNA-directed RNA polymerase subunit RPC12/RpoP